MTLRDVRTGAIAVAAGLMIVVVMVLAFGALGFEERARHTAPAVSTASALDQ